MASRISPASLPATPRARAERSDKQYLDKQHLSNSNGGTAAMDHLALEDVSGAIRRFQEQGDERALQEVMLAFDWVAVACARRMQRRGESIEDLEQVAREALIGAVSRFDIDRGVQFKSFAWATAKGALQHHYRSRWQVRVPRGLQELHLAVARAVTELTAAGSREPTVDELAAYMNVSRDHVILALDVGHVYLVDSLDYRRDDGSGAFDGALGSVDPDMEGTIDRVQVREMLESLPPQQRTALTMHYFEGSTQSEVGKVLGVSQAQVSRLMRSAITTLRVRSESWQDPLSQAVGA
jgi:RNA polymerase sigma-B factor